MDSVSFLQWSECHLFCLKKKSMLQLSHRVHFILYWKHRRSVQNVKMQKNTNSNKWFFNFNFVNISHFTYAFVSKKISLFNKSFSYSHPVIWYCRCSMALLSFFRDKREVDIFSSSLFVIKFRGYLENHTLDKTQNSHAFTQISMRIQSL